MKMRSDQIFKDIGIDLASSEGFHENRNGLGNADGVGQLDFAPVGNLLAPVVAMADKY